MPNNTKCWHEWGAPGTPFYCLWKCKMVQPLGKTIWQFLTKRNIVLTRNLVVMLLGIYPRDGHLCPLINLYIEVYKQFYSSKADSRCPSGEGSVSYGHCNNVPHTRWVKTTQCILSHFWRLEV